MKRTHLMTIFLFPILVLAAVAPGLGVSPVGMMDAAEIALDHPANVHPGYINGYNMGFNLGRGDVDAHRDSNPRRHREYARAMAEYDAGYGSRADYQQNFRLGFVDGYNDGYARVANRLEAQGPTPALYRAAHSRGYQDGYEHGRRDVQRRIHYNFAHDPIYQKADLGYDAQRHPTLEDYQFSFRTGYEAGYDDGYNNRSFNDRRNMRRDYTHRTRNEIRSSTGMHQRGGSDSLLSRAGSYVIPAGATLRLTLNNSLSTRSNQVGDFFTAQVVDPVYVQNAIAIPAGSTVHGVITRAARPGRVEGRGELNLRFDSLTLPNNRNYKLYASVSDVASSRVGGVSEEGGLTGRSSTGRDVGSVAIGSGLGALIGALAGGGRGAAVGAGVGAGVGLGAVFATRGKDLDLPHGTEMTITLNQPLEVRR